MIVCFQPGKVKSVTGEGEEALVVVLYPDGTEMTYYSRYLLRREETAGNSDSLEGALGNLSSFLSGGLESALGDHRALLRSLLGSGSRLHSSAESSSSDSSSSDDDDDANDGIEDNETGVVEALAALDASEIKPKGLLHLLRLLIVTK